MASNKLVVLDSSALLAFLKQENGHQEVKNIIKYAVMSAINLAECHYILRKIMPKHEVSEVLAIIRSVIDINKHTAENAGELYYNTRDLGLAMADCICLTLAKNLGCPVYTADKQWLKVSERLNLEIILIR